MNLVKLILFLSGLLLTGTACSEEINSHPKPGPGTYRITNPDGIIKIPFVVVRGDIRFVGEINGQEVRLLIDNGLLWDPLLFFGSKRVDKLGFAFEGEREITGTGTGDPTQSFEASNITLKFPDVEFYEQTAVVTSYNPALPGLFDFAEGQVSSTFFKHFVVDINFDDMVITLIEPTNFDYFGGGIALPIKQTETGMWSFPAVIKMNDGTVVSLDMEMDLGNSNALHLSTGGVYKIPLPENAVKASLGFGMSGEMLGHYGNVKSLQLGDFVIKDISAAFDNGNSLHEASFGFDLFSMFNVVFDYPHQMIYFAPNRHWGETFGFIASGMQLKNDKQGLAQIHSVWFKTAADNAGLRAGDKIIAVDGQDVSGLNIWELGQFLQAPGASLKLTVFRNGVDLETEITLGKIIYLVDSSKFTDIK